VASRDGRRRRADSFLHHVGRETNDVAAGNSATGGSEEVMAAMSGTNLVHDVGYVESGLTCSLEMLVSMNEAHGLVKRIMD
ncbi:MAG: hypothetical protein M1319_06465, partial [Chloroflexi bacterium]|nr:hypothetical protein [Chloroflexota bacterium]